MSGPESPAAGWRFDNSYARLPARLFSRVAPTPVAHPEPILFNERLARELGLDPDLLATPDAAPVFTGNVLPEGADPIAQAYAGHQYAHFTRLGDGRAILLGEQVTPDGRRFDIQLKGAGPTPYSRRGDGRAAVGPMLREYLISEAMHFLGIPTTRSLAVAATGEPVFRERPLPGAVLTRVASSHIRVGTFQLFAALDDTASLRSLLDHTVARHVPEAARTSGNPALDLLRFAIETQAALVVQWLRVGFVHGVMNTDNMALSGETIDYGPCAFIDAYDPSKAFSSIDHAGRYAFGRQPQIAGWNLSRLAEALIPVLDPTPERALEIAKDALGTYPDRFRHHWLSMMRLKLGLTGDEPGDGSLAEDLLTWMHADGSDYTHTFRALDPGRAEAAGGGDTAAFAAWHRRWVERLTRQDAPIQEATARMAWVNPAVVPRNRSVEAALASAVDERDLRPLQRLLAELQSPYDESGKSADLLAPPPECEAGYCTFCGT